MKKTFWAILLNLKDWSVMVSIKNSMDTCRYSMSMGAIGTMVVGGYGVVEFRMEVDKMPYDVSGSFDWPSL